MEGVPKESEVDRISALPDFLIQHILSFLPSTKEAIRTAILSKRWKDQWTHVPVLILKASDVFNGKFDSVTENVLLTYSSFKIKKFHLQYDSSFKTDPNFSAKIRFATRRNVQELALECNWFFEEMNVLLGFVFRHTSLVKLHTVRCTVMPNKEVTWESLKELSLSYCKVSNQAIESVLSGSPLLELLDIKFCSGFDKLSVFSNSLKRLVVDQPNKVLETSCPILEELTFCRECLEALSRFRFLKSLDLCRCVCTRLVITLESLTRLVLKQIEASDVDILCPNLKELKLEDLKDVGTLKLKYVSSLYLLQVV